jgi:hypothetical protein
VPRQCCQSRGAWDRARLQQSVINSEPLCLRRAIKRLEANFNLKSDYTRLFKNSSECDTAPAAGFSLFLLLSLSVSVCVHAVVLMRWLIWNRCRSRRCIGPFSRPLSTHKTARSKQGLVNKFDCSLQSICKRWAINYDGIRRALWRLKCAYVYFEGDV